MDRREVTISHLSPGAQAARSLQLSTARLTCAVRMSLGSVMPVVSMSIKPAKVKTHTT